MQTSNSDLDSAITTNHGRVIQKPQKYGIETNLTAATHQTYYEILDSDDEPERHLKFMFGSSICRRFSSPLN